MSRYPSVRLSTRRGRSPSSRRGFALLITVTLLAFLVLLMVSLASLTRVETQVASNNQQLTQARQNALFALNLALGQLQKAAGPDQRVTAPANVMLTGSSTSAAGVLDVGNTRWTGVWDSAPTSATYGQRLSWLVSGTTPNAATAITAGPALTDGVELVGTNSAVITGTGTDGNRVVVARQAITATDIPGFTPGSPMTIGSYAWWVGDEGVKARVNLGDPLRPLWFKSTASGKPAPDAIDGFNASSLAQRAAVEIVSEDIPTGSPLLGAHLDPSSGSSKLGQITSVYSTAQIALLDSSNATPLTTAVRTQFHTLTAWSAGVLTDVRNGGLKRDLTAAFELNDPAFQSSEFADAFPLQNGKDVRTPIYYTQNAPSSSYLGFVFTPAVPGNSNNFYRGPSWHLLRNHYRLYKEITNLTTTPLIGARPSLPAVTGGGGNPFVDAINGNNSPEYDPKVSNNTTFDMARGDQYGTVAAPKGMSRRIAPSLLPYINRITMVLSLQTVPTTGPTAMTPDGQPILDVRVVLTPYVVLHNPYSVELQLNDTTGDGFWGEINQRGIPFAQLVRAQTSSGDYYFSNRGGLPTAAPASGTIHDRALSLLKAEINTGNGSSYNSGLYYQIPSIILAPGEVRVFSPNKPIPEDIKINNKLKMSPNAYFSTGLYFDQLNGYKAPDYFGDLPAPVGCPIGAGGAIVPPSTPFVASDYLIRVPANMPISIAFTADLKAGSQIMRMSSEATGFAAASDRTNNDPWIDMPPVTGAQTAKNLAETVYSQYGTTSGGRSAIEQFKPSTATPAANFQTSVPTPILAFDTYTKPADHPGSKAARPFVTSNPMALVYQTTTLGDWQNITGTLPGGSVPRTGFPATAGTLQPEWRLLSPNAWTTNEVIEVDAGGNGRAYWGPSKTSFGVQTTAFIDVPKTPMTSLAQFQHLMIANYAYEPYFAIGNSYATPYTPLAMASPYLPGSYLSAYPNPTPLVPIVNPKKNGASARDWWMADLSYLSNEALWDSCFFSTLAPGFNGTSFYVPAPTAPSPDTNPYSRESIRDGWLTDTRQLPNTRIRPYLSPLRTDAVRKTQLIDYKRAAANMVVNGSFNINSRSVDAWAAVLGGARKASVPKNGGTTSSVGNDTGVARTIPSAGFARTTSTSDLWNGFAQLTDAQIRTLATAVVDQIKKRQTDSATSPSLRPFLSLAEFINRKISSSTDITLNQSGALQSALDSSGINGPVTGTTVDAASQNTFPYPTGGNGSAASAAAGNILQADILQQIGPFLSARSDTFTIRTYGESINPATGSVQGRAWCEAVVQRTPDYVNGTADAPEIATAALTSSENINFGRRFRVVSFRWLSPSDI